MCVVYQIHYTRRNTTWCQKRVVSWTRTCIWQHWDASAHRDFSESAIVKNKHRSVQTTTSISPDGKYRRKLEEMDSTVQHLLECYRIRFKKWECKNFTPCFRRGDLRSVQFTVYWARWGEWNNARYCNCTGEVLLTEKECCFSSSGLTPCLIK